MAPAFSKEAIFSGAVDYLCLVCQGYFNNEVQVIEHIREPGHRINLKGTDYVEKYKGDCIRKVKEWYFCELCNVVLTTIKVGLHVADAKHKRKASKNIKRDGDLVIISGKVAINEEAWHGLIGNTCTLCNIDFDDKETHKSKTAHIVNLIQSQVTDLDNIIFRKVDDAFHCLICNEGIAEVEGHVNDTNHKKLFRKSQVLTQKIEEKLVINSSMNEKEGVYAEKKDVIKNNEINSSMNEKESVNAEKKDVIKNNEHDKFTIENNVEDNVNLGQQGFSANTNNNKKGNDILDFITEFQKNQININFETGTAVCKQCSTALEFNSNEIEQHIRKHKENILTDTAAKKTVRPLLKLDENNKKWDSKTLFSSPVRLKHNIEKNKECLTEKSKNLINDDEKGIQKLVKDSIKANSVRNNSEVTPKKKTKTGKKEKSNDIEGIKKNVKICNLPKIPAIFIIKEMLVATVNCVDTECVINQQYCINFFSFVFCSIIGPGLLRCNMCHENQTISNLIAHIGSENHEKCLQEVPIIIHPDSEFIREIRTDQFHCGFCNVIKASWLEMEQHLKSTNHKESKIASVWRLEIHLQEMKKGNIPQNVDNTSFFDTLKKLNIN